MKDFNEFSDIVEKGLDQFEAEVIAEHRKKYPDGLSITEAIPKISANIALKLLRQYHEWLNDQG